MPTVKPELISDEMSQNIIETAKRLVTIDGVNKITVKKILTELEITNRVFYNRFHNIDEVLDVVYRSTALQMRRSILTDLKEKDDFFEHVKDVVTQALVMSYDIKMRFNQYVFENDSLSRENYEWWMCEIKKLIDHAKKHNYIKNVDSEVLSYSIWCFCRGYNADSVGRGIPKEEAVKNFRYSFGFLLDGLKK